MFAQRLYWNDDASHIHETLYTFLRLTAWCTRARLYINRVWMKCLDIISFTVHAMLVCVCELTPFFPRILLFLCVCSCKFARSELQSLSHISFFGCVRPLTLLLSHIRSWNDLKSARFSISPRLDSFISGVCLSCIYTFIGKSVWKTNLHRGCMDVLK